MNSFLNDFFLLYNMRYFIFGLVSYLSGSIFKLGYDFFDKLVDFIIFVVVKFLIEKGERVLLLVVGNWEDEM